MTSILHLYDNYVTKLHYDDYVVILQKMLGSCFQAFIIRAKYFNPSHFGNKNHLTAPNTLTAITFWQRTAL
jgi:hypothetical protein